MDNKVLLFRRKKEDAGEKLEQQQVCDFDKIAEKNREKEEKLRLERQKNNRGVLRGYRIKGAS